MRAWLVLFLGVAAICPAALFVRLAAEAAPLVIGAFRLSIASLVVVPAALLTSHREVDSLRRADAVPLIASGVCLALHFAFWISSLSYTSVASSTVLVTTTPLMLALLPSRWSGDTISPRTIAGVLLALVGTGVIAYADAGAGQHGLLGDALALLGAATIGAHRVIGRLVLARMGLLPYVAVTYPIAAMLLLTSAIVSGAPLAGFSASTYAAIAALALFPQVIGHTSANWALRRLSAVAVSTAIMVEPVGASLLAMLVLSEVPSPWVVVGGAAVLAGVSLVVRSERSTAAVNG